MSLSLEGKVAVITGGARGQGRAHAVALASAGADVALLDCVTDLPTVPYRLAASSDLDQTRQLVEETGRRCRTHVVDVRDGAGVQRVVDAVVDEWGHVDIALANAGILSWGLLEEMPDAVWDEMIQVNLSGVFCLFRAVGPIMRMQRSGRIVATSSMAGRTGCALIGHYAAAKWGVIGLAKSFALEMAPHGVTVNVVAPVAVDTEMVNNAESVHLYVPDRPGATRADVAAVLADKTAMNVPWIDAADVTAAVMYLVSEGARYVTGEVLHIGAGRSAWNAV